MGAGVYPNEDGFILERSSNGGTTWSRILQTAANVKSFTDTGLKSRKTYKYRLQSLNFFGGSAYSNTVSGTTL